MKKLLMMIAALALGATPALAQTAQTTSVQLDDLALKVENATVLDHNNDIAAWNLLKEPVQTYAHRTLNAGGAPNYITSIDLASNELRPPPPYWIFELQELIAKPPVGNSANRFYVSAFSFWEGTPDKTYPDAGMRWESGGQSRVNRASAVVVAALRAWAYVLRQNGR